ncbi:S-layer homology domain-containing protein [Paenibacillus thalictri]|uniref:SLH domain-containing protein n=1 Tax=Paenibacillus thalictri TaxID=2527873 RepID=A0A4Q9DGD7_9BACL|nr:S-layer homology domain-containing protein [Paenibacillus thalictri]TBL71212.1 hypothetical protein EYB31_31045 [Paenibacillus thalictri]
MNSKTVVYIVLFAFCLLAGTMGFCGIDGPNKSSVVNPLAAGTVSAATYSSQDSTSLLNSLALSVSGADLTPGFSPTQYAYSATVDYSVDKLNINATAENPAARVLISGSETNSYPAALNVGKNTFQIVVTSPDKSSISTYTIVITRSLASADSYLSGLSVNTGRLDHSFERDRFEYLVIVDHSVDYLYISAAASNINSKISAGSNSVTGSGMFRNIDKLTDGETLINITVTSEDGTSQVYKITIRRGTEVIVTSGSQTASAGLDYVSPAAQTESKDENSGSVLNVKASADDIKTALGNPSVSRAVIDATSYSAIGKTVVTLTGSLLKAAADKNKAIVIQTNKTSLELPPGSVTVSADDEEFKWTIRDMENGEAALLARPAGVVSVPAAVDITLFKNGVQVPQPNKPLPISIKADPTKYKNASKLGAYGYNASKGVWEYIGGTINSDGAILFTIDRYANYAIMEYAASFRDTAGHWAESYIQALEAKHIASGVSDQLFAPDANITRAEFAALLVRALNVNVPEKSGFNDVPSDAWYRSEVGKAYAAKLIDGIGENTFAPNQTITREQMAVMMIRAYSFKTGVRVQDMVSPRESKYTDESAASDWARRSIRLTDAAELMNGNPDGTFQPQERATRAQAIAVLSRLLDRTAAAAPSSR